MNANLMNSRNLSNGVYEYKGQYHVVKNIILLKTFYNKNVKP